MGVIDFAGIVARVDLQSVVEADLGPAGRGGRWVCPFHPGASHLNFSVRDRRFRCWSCGATGDVLDFVAKREGVTLAEAAAKLDPATVRTPGTHRKGPRTPPERSEAVGSKETQGTSGGRTGGLWGDSEWQAAVSDVVERAVATLWDAEGRQALSWLHARGFEDHVIRRFRLGFLPYKARSRPLAADRGGCLEFVRGVTIPWVAPGASYDPDDTLDDGRWVGLNVRRLAEGDVFGPLPRSVEKYRAVRGSERGHGYPWPENTQPGMPAIVCEGEFDALTAWQEIGHVANVVAFGGATSNVRHPDARSFLGACPDWLLSFDADDAGDVAARDMARQSTRRCRRLYLPPEFNDLNDFHRSGASVRDWLRCEYARFGWA